MSINTEINRLLNFAKQHELISDEDMYYSANRLLDVLQVVEFEPENVDEALVTAEPILKNMLDYAWPRDRYTLTYFQGLRYTR